MDRALSLAMFRPLLHASGGGRRQGIPILMYHGIRSRTGNRHPYFETNTSPRQFASQLRYLRDNGYETLTLDRAVQMGNRPREVAKPVVLTFDDAYRDFHSCAFPLLAEFGFVATVFVVSGFAQGAANGQNAQLYMTWQQIREMRSHGIEIGSHTVSHPELHRIPMARVSDEVTESKAAIEREIEAPVRSFAYPNAFPQHERAFLKGLRELLMQAGYTNGVCTTIGTARPADESLFMPRIPVNDYDDLRFFESKLEGAYNWLRIAQSLRKYFRSPAAILRATEQ